MKVDYELSIEDALALHKRLLHRNFLFKPIALIVSPVLAVFLAQSNPTTHTYSGPHGRVTEPFLGFWFDLAIWTIIIVGVVLLIRRGYNRRIREEITRNPDSWDGARSLLIDTDKIVSKSRHIVAEIDPSIIKRVEEDPDYIFIFYYQDAAWTIPKRFLPSDVDTLRIRVALLPREQSAT